MRLPPTPIALGVLYALSAAPAYAGGIAPIVSGGFHTERVFYYSKEQEGGAGNPIRDPANYERYDQIQAVGNAGVGLEIVLGDRDDLVQGVFRGFWMLDTPQADPSKAGVVDADAIVSAYRTTPRNTGAGTVGMQWGLVRAANDKFKAGLSIHAGAGFLTPDHSEFLIAQAGGFAGYQMTRGLEAFIDVDYTLRVQKTLSNGLTATAGLRVLFD
jgi:hypothetical protein